MMRTKRRLLAGLLAAAVFLAAAFAIEYAGGRGGVPTWAQLYRRLGLEAGLPEAGTPEAGLTTVTVFDVGQGDAVLIAQDGEYCLVDTGTAESADGLVYGLQLAGVEELALLVLTHPHADHTGGALAVLEAIPTRQLLVPDPDQSEELSGRWRSVLACAERQGVPVTAAEAGQEYPLGGGLLTVLQAGYLPAEDSEDDAVNDSSLCFRFTAGAFSYLGTGDAEREAEAALTDRYGSTLRSTLLKAGHHGSSTSNGEAFLRAVQPQAVVFSCGLDNEYGHPHAEIVRRCEELNIKQWRTDLDGTVVFTWDGTALRVQTAAADGRQKAA